MNITNVPIINSTVCATNENVALELTNQPMQTESTSAPAPTPLEVDLNAEKKFTKIFFKCFKEITSMSHLFQLSVDTLNKANLIPNKDYNQDKLVSGMLQLPEKFHLIIDETSLSTGELNQKGLMNMHALNDVIKWQKLNYDFGFHAQEFLTDMRLLIFSTTKSILSV